MKRYLVSRAIDEELGQTERSGFVLTVVPGDEVELDDETYALVNATHPGALLEMDPRTKTDWDRLR